VGCSIISIASINRVTKLACRCWATPQSRLRNELSQSAAIGGRYQDAGSQFNLYCTREHAECWNQVKVNDGSAAGVFVVWRDRRVGRIGHDVLLRLCDSQATTKCIAAQHVASAASRHFITIRGDAAAGVAGVAGEIDRVSQGPIPTTRAIRGAFPAPPAPGACRPEKRMGEAPALGATPSRRPGQSRRAQRARLSPRSNGSFRPYFGGMFTGGFFPPVVTVAAWSRSSIRPPARRR
jgi:hypothetical protein